MKRPTNKYLDQLVKQDLCVDDFIKQMRKEGYLQDGGIIHLGAASAWLFEGTYDEYEDKIDLITMNLLDASEKNYKNVDKVIKAMLDNPVVQGENTLMEYALCLEKYAKTLKRAIVQKNKYAHNIRLGVLRGRKVVESYVSTYLDNEDVMIRVDGHEIGKGEKE